MYCKEELQVVTEEIRTALMMMDAGYGIALEDIAEVCLRKAYWIRHTNACTRNRLRQSGKISGNLKKQQQKS